MTITFLSEKEQTLPATHFLLHTRRPHIVGKRHQEITAQDIALRSGDGIALRIHPHIIVLVQNIVHSKFQYTHFIFKKGQV